MTIRALQDSVLAILAQQLNLEAPADSGSWLARAEQELGVPRLEELQDWRKRLYAEARQASPKTSLASEAAFYQFVAANQVTSRVMLEGRLGYYDAILPAVAARIGQVPHARILDLGSYSGLPSLYLAKRFPDAQVVGIERCHDAVQRAQELRARTGVQNVEFVAGDYLTYAPAEGYAVVLSLQTIPTYLLPWLPAEEPESYLRGRILETASPTALSASQTVADALSACVRLVNPNGRVMLHERFRDYADAALFQYLAHRVGLKMKEHSFVYWQAANERQGTQQAPLYVGEPQPGPIPFDEAAFSLAYMPVAPRLDLASPQVDQGVILNGPAAHANFQALPAGKNDVCVALYHPDDVKVHVHLGIAAQQAAYVYTCSTRDQRELKICRASRAGELFAPVLEFIERTQQSSEGIRIEPELAQLTALVKQMFTI